MTPKSPGGSSSSPLTGSRPAVAFFCATHLKPEMHHVHRQINGLSNFQPRVITQKLENATSFPVAAPVVVPRSGLRFFARLVEKHVTGRPWQISNREAAAIRNALAACHARALHVFFGNVAVHLLPLLRSVELPVVVSFHGADVAGAIASPAYQAARLEVFERASIVAARSAELAGRVAALGCAPEKIRIVRTSIPEMEFMARAPREDGGGVIVQACRLIPKKGVATSLRAFAALADRAPRATFIVAGTGPLEAPLRALAGELGIGDRVRFAGFLDQPALRALFASAHVFVHPSESVGGDVEGVPNSMLEAMASGLPVVATRHGGIPEAIDDEVSGLLCDEGDVAGVAAAMLLILEDPGLAGRLAAGGAAAVREKFPAPGRDGSLDALYGSLIAGR